MTKKSYEKVHMGTLFLSKVRICINICNVSRESLLISWTKINYFCELQSTFRGINPGIYSLHGRQLIICLGYLFINIPKSSLFF